MCYHANRDQQGPITFCFTYPNVSISVIRFPVPSCITVEEAVLRHPVRTAVATLRCYGAHLLPGAEVHLQPLVMITVQR